MEKIAIVAVAVLLSGILTVIIVRKGLFNTRVGL